MRRVVITGLGIISPLAANKEASWKKLINGESGASQITHFDPKDHITKIACEIPSIEKDPINGFDPNHYVDVKEQKRMDRFITLAIAAAEQAIRDASLNPQTEAEKDRIGVLVGAGIGGLNAIDKSANILSEKGPKRISPFFIPSALINLASGQISIKYGYRGPNHSVVTACASGAHAIGDAARLIMYEDADIMIAGGSEATITPLGIAGFNACKALSTGFNDTPEKASRPYDKERDGFVMGEGGAILVLEEYEHAKKRGAHIYAEIIGYGLSGDAYHMTSPEPSGSGGYRAMQAALKRANIDIDAVDYVNAHGTSTPVGDEVELKAIEKLYAASQKKDIFVSSTKSSVGHLLGGAGAIEAAFSILSIQHNVIPPTLNLDNPSVETKINLVPHTAIDHKVNIVLSNSFGFGGTNASLIFKGI